MYAREAPLFSALEGFRNHGLLNISNSIISSYIEKSDSLRSFSHMRVGPGPSEGVIRSGFGGRRTMAHKLSCLAVAVCFAQVKFSMCY